MNTTSPIEFAWRSILLVCLLAIPATVFSQTVVSAPMSSAVATIPPPSTSRAKPLARSDIGSVFSALNPFRTWGAFKLHPHMSYQVVYTDGILSAPGETTSTTTHTLSLGAGLALGNHWTLSYTGSRTWQSSESVSDYTSHNVSLSGEIEKGDWTFGFGQSYSTQSATLVETGRQTPETSYATSGSAAYQLGQRTRLSLSVSRSSRDSDLPVNAPQMFAPDVTQWSGNASAHYRYSSKLDFSIGIGIGEDNMSQGSDMDVSEPQVTVSWRPTNKLSFSGSGGLQTRKFQETGEDLETSTYSGTASYQPFTYTTLSLSTSRSTVPSYFANQVSRSQNWGANVQQRLLQRFYLAAGYSRGRSEYLIATRGLQEARDDDYSSYSLSISTVVLRRASMSLSYQESENTSNIGDFGFSSHTIGFNVGYRF